VDTAVESALEFQCETATATATETETGAVPAAAVGAVAVAPAPVHAPASSSSLSTAADAGASGVVSVSGVRRCSWDPLRLAQLAPSGLVVALLSHQWELRSGPDGGFASLRRRLAELSHSTLTPAQSEALHAFVTSLQRSLRAPCQRLQLPSTDPHIWG
jgi:hypothetical protein